MMHIPSLIRRTVSYWQAWKCRQRFARLCRMEPALGRASERLSIDRRQHRRTKSDLAAIRQAMSERLRREIAG